MEKTCSSGVEVDQLLTLQPICIVEDMVTSGVSISKSRIGQFYIPTLLSPCHTQPLSCPHGEGLTLN